MVEKFRVCYLDFDGKGGVAMRDYGIFDTYDEALAALKGELGEYVILTVHTQA